MNNTTPPTSLQAASEQAAAKIAAMPVRPKVISCPICGLRFISYDDLNGHYISEHPDSIPPIAVTLNVNGKNCDLIIEPQLTLKQVLQFHLGLTGAKEMCDRGACGSCTVIINSKPALSCNILAAECDGKIIETVEGIALIPKWKPLIDAYCKWDAMQCGYCTPGFLVAAKALLERNPSPTVEEINKALSGNICICGTYPRHAQAITEAVEFMAMEYANAVERS
ncbi:MAG: (2Fe-2S)-binding protein [Oscillospiraceae bacterium]|jgi:xanthine dehydrogenase YagT iron-sulfur-binding subunit|nr:(2Fe-2S)-binding protein [Oscillospiraceae bacterium]